MAAKTGDIAGLGVDPQARGGEKRKMAAALN